MYLFKKKKRSVSPLIATILLIVVSVILVTVVLTWGKDFVGDSLEETTSFYQESNLTGFITSQGNINNFVTIANNHSRESISVIGYRIITSTDHKHFHLLNNDYYLEEKITINPRQSSTIRVHCLPETSFSLDLLLEDNSFVRVNVNVRDYSFNLCSIYDDLVVAYDMKTIDGNKLIDVSGNGFDGVITGATYVYDNEKHALSFNGVDNYITPILSRHNIITITFWMKINDIEDYFTNNHDISIVTDFIRIRLGITSRRFGVRWQHLDESYETYFGSLTNEIENNKWHFCVFSYDFFEKKMKMYFDGELKLEEEVDWNYTELGLRRIGYNSTNEWYYLGFLSKIKFFNRILSNQEVKLLYNKGIKP